MSHHSTQMNKPRLWYDKDQGKWLYTGDVDCSIYGTMELTDLDGEVVNGTT